MSPSKEIVPHDSLTNFRRAAEQVDTAAVEEPTKDEPVPAQETQEQAAPQ